MSMPFNRQRPWPQEIWSCGVVNRGTDVRNQTTSWIPSPATLGLGTGADRRLLGLHSGGEIARM